MHCRRVGEDAYFVVLEKDEKVAASLLKAAASHGVEGGWIQGFGSVRDVELAWFDPAGRVYRRRKFEEDMELSGFLGDLALSGAERVLHAHASVSGPELITFSGHFVEARVSVSAEFLLQDLGVRLDRSETPSAGVKLLLGAPGKPPRAPRAKREGGA
ncbi:MAG: DNA-binding protein [Planctomycetes bacterium]|nr:DNA-binding protein [Planctomycetota bacterium]